MYLGDDRGEERVAEATAANEAFCPCDECCDCCGDASNEQVCC